MRAIALVASVVLVAPAARAADYPTKPITLMIGFAPGGPSDVMARILTRKMEEILRQPLVIENRAGAGGGIAGAAVARATPDGYTVLLATGSLLAINVSLYKNLGYDPEKDFEPISRDRNPDQRALHPSFGAGEIAGRADRLCQGQSREAHLRLRRERHAGPSRRRASQDGSQARDDACAVPGHGPGAAGGHRRPCPHGLQSAAAAAAASPERHDPGDCDYHARAHGRLARGADHRQNQDFPVSRRPPGTASSHRPEPPKRSLPSFIARRSPP